MRGVQNLFLQHGGVCETSMRIAGELGLLRKRSFSTSGNGQKNSKSTGQQFAFLIIIDFESTCWKDDKFKSQEIIEFPAVLLNTSSGEVESEFHHYVQPQEQPTLSAFCTELTGITQDKVDEGIPINLCLKKFCHWLDKLYREKGVVCCGQTTPDGKSPTCTIVTWSDWDLGVCLQYECKRKQLLKPVQLTSWIDLRATYRKFYDRKPNGLNGALQDLGISFEGREHSGLDDSRNTAKLAYRMIQDGCVMKVTKTLKNQENATNKTSTVKDHFLPTRISPPRKAKDSSTTSRLSSSPIQIKNNSSPGIKKSKIPRPVCNSESESEQDKNLTPTKSCFAKGKLIGDTDGRSPLAKRRRIGVSPKQNKLVNSKTPKKTSSQNVVNKIPSSSPKNKMPNKHKTIPQTSFSPSDIYVDQVDTNKGESNLTIRNQSAQKGLKAQDVNVQRKTINKPNFDKNFKRPLSPSQNGIQSNTNFRTPKSPVSSIKPSIKVQSKFQTSTPISRGNTQKVLSKSFAPSPINSTNSTSSVPSKGHVTPPSTPMNKVGQGQISTFVTPGINSGRTTNPVFKTPSPVGTNRSNSVNSSSVFKTPSPVSGTPGSAMKSTPPLCKCGRRSKRRMVQSPGQNTGRFFFSCSVRHSAASKNGCDFFKWETSFSPASNNSFKSSNSSLTARTSMNTPRQYCPTPVHGASFKTTSFKTPTATSYKRSLGVKSVTVRPACPVRV